MYSPEFLARLGTSEAAGPMLDFIAPLPRSVPPLERMLALEQRFFLADHNLTYTDKMSMAVGVKVRVPLLDLELVDFAARIPPAVKRRGQVGKWVFKRAMEPYLEFNYLVRHAKAVITDSGGITEETTVMGVPCMTLRTSTERPETVSLGTNELLGVDPASLAPALDRLFAGEWKRGQVPPLWDGKTSERIVAVLERVLPLASVTPR